MGFVLIIAVALILFSLMAFGVSGGWDGFTVSRHYGHIYAVLLKSLHRGSAAPVIADRRAAVSLLYKKYLEGENGGYDFPCLDLGEIWRSMERRGMEALAPSAAELLLKDFGPTTQQEAEAIYLTSSISSRKGEKKEEMKRLLAESYYNNTGIRVDDPECFDKFREKEEKKKKKKGKEESGAGTPQGQEYSCYPASAKP